MKTPVISLLFLIGILTTGCGHSKTVSSTVSHKQQDVLSASLAKLGDTLANKSPFIFAKLAPGATPEDIHMLRAELGGAEIQCLELWYRWHNGCTGHITDVLPLGRMLSIAEAVEDRKR